MSKKKFFFPSYPYVQTLKVCNKVVENKKKKTYVSKMHLVNINVMLFRRLDFLLACVYGK